MLQSLWTVLIPNHQPRESVPDGPRIWMLTGSGFELWLVPKVARFVPLAPGTLPRVSSQRNFQPWRVVAEKTSLNEGLRRSRKCTPLGRNACVALQSLHVKACSVPTSRFNPDSDGNEPSNRYTRPSSSRYSVSRQDVSPHCLNRLERISLVLKKWRPADVLFISMEIFPEEVVIVTRARPIGSC